MKNYYFLISIVFLLVLNPSFSQEMPIDFSDSSDNFTAFSGSGFAFNIDPTEGSNQVGQFFNDGSNAWQGFTIDLLSPVDLDFQNTISLSFYGFDPNTHTILLKLENGANPDVQVTQNVPSGGGWTNNITFNFANAVLSSDGTTPINATGTYNRLTIFIDGGVTTAGTYLIDNVDDGSIVTNTDPVYDNLVWSDEFDGTGPIDSSKWYQQTQLIAGDSWANGEQQHYTNRIDNSFRDNGSLKIIAKGETFTDQGVTKQYTSARLNSKFSFQYGRVEVRAKLPSIAGTWPAIWLLGKNINENGGYWDNEGFGTTTWPACGEIDIMEPNIAKTQILATWHWDNGSGYMYDSSSIATSNTDTSQNFHIYELIWSPQNMKIYMDGILINQLDSIDPFNQEFYILLNVAMGGNLGGAIQPGFNQDTMEIDYVRVYQETPLSTEEFTKNPMISFYPNPVSTDLNISINDSNDQKGQLQIMDVSGRIINKASFKVSANKFIHNTNGLQSGLYFMKLLLDNGKEHTFKFIKN